MKFKIGDILFREDMAKAGRQFLGLLTGYSPSDDWVRVCTMDGRYRLWKSSQCAVIEDEGLTLEWGREIKHTARARRTKAPWQGVNIGGL